MSTSSSDNIIVIFIRSHTSEVEEEETEIDVHGSSEEATLFLKRRSQIHKNNHIVVTALHQKLNRKFDFKELDAAGCRVGRYGCPCQSW